MKKILVVDNDPVLLKLMTRLLEKEGHQVMVAEDGLQALDAMKTYTPDIIFVDLVMPIIDGRMLCKIIREIDSLKAAKVIILSAIAAEERTDLSQLGVCACIAKGPFHLTGQHVLDLIHQIDLVPAQDLPKEPIGIKDVYPRGITEELLIANRNFEMILEKMSEGVVGMNSEGRIIYANPSFFSMLDMSEHELFGSYFVDLFSGIDRMRVSKLMNNKDGKSHAITEKSQLCLNKRLVTLEFLPFREHGFSRVIVKDITERKRAEEELRKDKEKFRVLVEESPLGIALIGKNGCYQYINPGFIKMFGYTLADIPTGAQWFIRAYPSKLYRNQAIPNRKM